MNYLGIFIGEDPLISSYALINKNLQNMKREYTLSDIGTFSQPFAFSQVKSKIEAVYNDESLVKVKTVFSQEGRPPKTVHAKPYIVGGFLDNGKNLFDPARDADLPVECVYIQKEKKAIPEVDYRKQIGANYAARPEKIDKVFINVLKERRLAVSPDSPLKKDMEEAVKTFDPKAGNIETVKEKLGPLFRAMAIVFWYNESVRKILRY